MERGQREAESYGSIVSKRIALPGPFCAEICLTRRAREPDFGHQIPHLNAWLLADFRCPIIIIIIILLVSVETHRLGFTRGVSLIFRHTELGEAGSPPARHLHLGWPFRVLAG